MLISLIVAMAKNRVIGRNGQIPWHLPTDLQRFKRLTMGQALLMGRRTFESIGRPLPGRWMIVLSGHSEYTVPGCDVVSDIDSALELAQPAEELFICGGSDIYRDLFPRVDRIYLTELDEDVEGDTFFPELPLEAFETIHSARWIDAIEYRFSILQRRGKPSPMELINEKI